MKSDWFVRLILVAILAVLTAHVAIEFWTLRINVVRSPVGRYVQHPSEHSIVILDTQTGAMYVVGSDGKLMETNIVERAKASGKK